MMIPALNRVSMILQTFAHLIRYCHIGEEEITEEKPAHMPPFSRPSICNSFPAIYIHLFVGEDAIIQPKTCHFKDEEDMFEVSHKQRMAMRR